MTALARTILLSAAAALLLVMASPAPAQANDDDYWDNYRTAIRQVSAPQALAAARSYIHPDNALVVVVGRAADVLEPLRRFGPVTVYNTAGVEMPQGAAETPPPTATE